MNDHLCILWCYNNVEHIIKCFESVQMSTMDYFIVENRSPHSLELQKYFHEKRVVGHIRFKDNIADNAVKIFFHDYKRLLYKYKYITFSDGDLRLDNARETFAEVRKILDHKEVGVCAVDLKLDNFPYDIAKPSDWLPGPVGKTDDYIECATGAHMMTLKTENLSVLVDAKKAIDGCFREMCANMGLKWVKTIKNKAYHLTWDYYHKGNPYYDFRVANPKIFVVTKFCRYIRLK